MTLTVKELEKLTMDTYLGSQGIKVTFDALIDELRELATIKGCNLWDLDVIEVNEVNDKWHEVVRDLCLCGLNFAHFSKVFSSYYLKTCETERFKLLKQLNTPPSVVSDF